MPVGGVVSCAALLGLLAPCIASHQPRPNIVLIVADDLGWNDIGFHGVNDISTPNIDALAYNGVILNSHYSQALCTPSRAALLTGKYPIHTGTQHNVILEAAPWGLPLDQKLLPQYLNELGYSSHAFGKWHLGYYKKAYTPTFRGFKSHYGFWNGFQDYFNHTVQASFSPFEGMDMRRDMAVDWETVGQYTTRLLAREVETVIRNHNVSEPLFLYLAHLAVHAANFENPLQAPQSTIDEFKRIHPVDRRKYAAMLWELDQSVGQLVHNLKEKGILENTIIVFVSDNGAATEGIHKNTGSNWPLKGEKATPWEGGIRTASFVWSSQMKRKHEVLNSLMHITDWLPTLYTAAGGDVEKLGDIDGIGQWEHLNGKPCHPRNEILLNIDDIYGYAAMRIGNYKYVNGTTFYGYLDNWVGEIPNSSRYKYSIFSILHSQVNSILGNITSEDIKKLRKEATVSCPKVRSKINKCNPLKRPCLFNISDDPCETNDISGEHKEKMEEFKRKLGIIRLNMRPPGNKRVESRANPVNYNNTWTNWGDMD